MLNISAQSLFAHRGLHDASMPRNSLSAIVAAAEAGYGIEFDVRLSRDGIPMVIHDADTMADTGIDLHINETNADVLRSLLFTGTSEPLSTLDDVLREVGPEVPLLIELKPTSRIRETVAEVAKRVAGREASVALQSFHPGIVRVAKRHSPRFAVGQLGEAVNPDMPWPEALYWRTLFSNVWTRPDFLGMHISALDTRVVQFWRTQLRCPVLGWTVEDEAGVAQCRGADAGMIFEAVRP